MGGVRSHIISYHRLGYIGKYRNLGFGVGGLRSSLSIY